MFPEKDEKKKRPVLKERCHSRCSSGSCEFLQQSALLDCLGVHLWKDDCSRISHSCYLVQGNFGKKLFEFINFSCHAKGHQLKRFCVWGIQRKAIPPAPTETTHCCQSPSRGWLQAGKRLRCCHRLPPTGLGLGSHPSASLGQVCGENDINHQINAKRVVILTPQEPFVVIWWVEKFLNWI